MVDPNMETALRWANELGPCPILPSSLHDVNQRVKLVQIMDTKTLADSLFADFFRELSNEQKIKCQNAIAKVSRDYIPDVNDDKILTNLSLRIWSGCLSAAKTIALRTMNGPNTPDIRQSIFKLIIEPISQKDPIYRAGVEVAPSFKRLRGEEYSFEGIPQNSVVYKGVDFDNK